MYLYLYLYMYLYKSFPIRSSQFQRQESGMAPYSKRVLFVCERNLAESAMAEVSSTFFFFFSVSFFLFFGLCLYCIFICLCHCLFKTSVKLDAILDIFKAIVSGNIPSHGSKHGQRVGRRLRWDEGGFFYFQTTL